MFLIDNYEHKVDDVMYVKESILGPGVDPSDFYSYFKNTCTCSFNEICVDERCKCISSTGKNYVSSLLALDKLQNSSVYECGAFCSCNFSTCSNRLVQKGPNPRLEIRLTEKKGYGLFTLDKIPPGTFICEYAGELISKEVAMRRCENKNNAKYLLHLREHYGLSTIENFIDAFRYSNIGRYINSSCSPNATIIPTRTGCIIPRAAVFTTMVVNKDDEITYFYGEGGREGFGFGSPCFCYADNCSGYLPLSLSPL